MSYDKKRSLLNLNTGEVINTTEDKMRSVMSYVKMLADGFELSDETVKALIPRMLKGESVDLREVMKLEENVLPNSYIGI
jgi:hypothetical protein